MALLDVVFTCALIGVMVAIAIPSLYASRERHAAVMAARYLAARFSVLRIDAVRRNRTMAVRFDPDDLGRFGTYVDGDGDGVLEADIDAGIDVQVDDDIDISSLFTLVSLRVPIDVPAPDGNGIIAADSDPVRIGNSNLVSFGPVGTATSGTIYLAGRDGTQTAVRILGATGRVRVLRFDRANDAWRQD
jgi:hypothetical protein